MKKLLCIPLLLLFGGLVFGQVNNVPPCINGAVPPACTDYFGSANWANSPLPVGSVGSVAILSGGSGYLNGGSGLIPSAPPPTPPNPYPANSVVVEDFYGAPLATGAIATATVTNGVITAVTVGAAPNGSGYIAPVVTITDATGSAGAGVIVSATLDPTSLLTGGMHKFVNTLPTTLGGLPVAAAELTPSFPNSQYYEIALVEYAQQMHLDLLSTTKLRGYVQVPTNSGTNTCTVATGLIPTYLGPVIVAQKDVPVRVKFTNCLPTTANGGNLFIPNDTTYMGAGMGPGGGSYSENRATLHLHGGATPWISDGTPHQWITPNGETTTPGFDKGDSQQNVPDMWFDANGQIIASCAAQPTCAVAGATNDPGSGSATFFWTNQQGGRLMFFHDHAYGLTRLNVYVGEAAGYLLVDPAEETLLLNANAGVPGLLAPNTTPDLAHLVPLVIQDKTFVPSLDQLMGEDPTWSSVHGGGTPAGNLWFPHVYTTNQNPADAGGANAFGRWDYGPWFFPPQTSLSAATGGALELPCESSAFPGQVLQPTTACPTCGCPIIPNPSGTPEAFMDTPLVNGVAYPVLHVAPEAYRFRILSVGNDRTLNLSLFQAADKRGLPTTAGTAVGHSLATLCTSAAQAPNCTEVAMVPFSSAQNAAVPFPASWYTVVTNGFTFDDRAGGVPDPATMGPPFIQIGTEGGLLPAVAVVQPQPINYVYNRRDITVGNVLQHALLLGPAERADVIVDFTGRSGQTLMLYNDAPAPVPAADPRIDYYTGSPSQVDTGGAPSTLPGYGPNTRTIMQIVVDQPASGAPAFNLTNLQSALPGIFAATQPQIIIPEPAYQVASGGNSTTLTQTGISDNTITYTPVGATSPVTYTDEQKAIQELFTLDYGRMNATLGVEIPLTNFLTQTTIPYGYIDPPTEIIQDATIAGITPQFWKITHNGVDTHFIHFHLMNVQVINRVGWDGAKRAPDANELGWKETVRMNPLEDILVALKPIRPALPFPLPDSVRLLDVTNGNGSLTGFTGVDPNNLPVTIANNLVNFGWEYVWHCHILGHEENDMMRPIVFQVAPDAPSNLTASSPATGPFAVNLDWIDNSASESRFAIQRATDNLFTLNVTNFTASASTPNTAYGGHVTFSDTSASKNQTYFYRVQAIDDFTPVNPLPAPWQAVPLASAWVTTQVVVIPIAGVAPTSLAFGNQLVGTASAAQTVTLSDTGGGNLTITAIAASANYAISGGTCPAGGGTLLAGTSCTISVTFNPTTTGALPGTLTVTDDSNGTAGSTQTVTLSGTGIAPVASASPLSLNFGGVAINTTSPAQTVTLSNTGTGPLTINSITASANFARSTTCGTTLAQGANCTISVTFRPTANTTYNGSLTISSNDPAHPTITVTLSGSGAGPVLTVTPPSLAFGNQNLNVTSTAQTVTVSNTGTLNLTLNSISLTGTNANQFGQTNTCGPFPRTLLTGASCTVNVTFRPTTTGAKTASLSVNPAAPVTAKTVALTGTGVSLTTAVTLNPTSLDFGRVTVGQTSAPLSVTLTSSGGSPVTVTNVGISGGNAGNFAVVANNCLTTLNPGATCSVSVTFTPATKNRVTSSLVFTDNAPSAGSTQSVALGGRGR